MEIKNEKKSNPINKILENYSMETLQDEKEIFEIIEKISNEPNSSYNEKIINNIDNYLKTKEKMKIANNDLEFLTNIANALRNQEVRMTDINYPPLFKITNPIGEDVYFLTRDALAKYKEYNKSCGNVIDVPSSNSMELSTLIEIIKRNF